MDVKSLRKFRLDLSRADCRSMRVTFKTALTEAIASNLGFSQEKSRFKSFFEEYTRNDIKHSIILRITKQTRQQDIYAIRLTYEIVDPALLEFGIRIGTPSKGRKVSDVFSYICNIKDALLFQCDCVFSYDRKDKFVPFVLPIKVDYQMFDELRGLRFVKLENEKIIWENSINIPNTDTMTHRVRFAIDSRCHLDLPKTLLTRAREISRKTFS